jgi:hypothetical protein
MQGALGIKGGSKPIYRVAESGMEGVSHGLDDVTTMSVDSLTHDEVVAGKGSLHSLRVLLPAFSTAFYIGEQESYGT